MLNRFKAWFIKQTGFNENLTFERMKAQLLIMFIMAGMAISVISLIYEIIVTLFAKSLSIPSYLIFSSIGLIFLFILYRASRVKYRPWFSNIFLLLVVVLITLFDASEYMRFVGLYIVPIIAASFLLRPRSSFLVAIASLAAFTIKYLLYPSAFQFYIFIFIVFFLPALVSWIIARRLERVYQNSQNIAKKYEAFIEHTPGAIYIIEYSPDPRCVYANSQLTAILGFEPDDWIKDPLFWRKQLHPEDKEWVIREDDRCTANGEPFHAEYRMIRKDHTIVWVSDDAFTRLEHGKPYRMQGVIQDISKRKKADQIQSVIQRVSQSLASTMNLEQLYHFIHQSLGELMPVENFYIALYDPAKNLIEFPYHVDQFDPTPEPYAPRRGLTEYVIRSGKPLLASPEGLENLVKAGEVKRIGAASLDWLGVPLIVENQTIGVMAVQTYTEGIRFSQEDLEVLSVVSTQIALVIYRKRIEEKLYDSEQTYRTLVDASPDVIIVVDRDGVIQFASPQLNETMRLKPELAITGSRLDSWVIQNNRTTLTENLKRVLLGESLFNSEYTLISPEGNKVDAEINSSPLKDSSGEITGVVTIWRDITQRKLAEKVQATILKVSQSSSTSRNLDDLYSSIHKNLGELMPVNNFYIALYNAQENLLEFPYYVDEYDGKPEPYTPGKGLTEYVMRTRQPLLASPEALQELVKAGEVKRVGSLSLDWLGVPLVVENQTIGVVAVQTYKSGVRFTKADLEILSVVSVQIALAIYRKRIEEKLNASEEQYRTLVEASPDIIIVSDLENKITYTSEHLQELLPQLKMEDVIGSDLFSWTPLEDRDRARKNFERVFKGERVVDAEYTIISPTGRRLTMDANSGLLRDSRGKGIAVVTILRDFTERRMIENALRESENRYHGIFNGVRDAIFVESLDGRILDFNESAMSMFGYTREELLKLPVSGLVPPGYKPLYDILDSDLGKTLEFVNVRSNGEIFPIEISLTRQQIGDQQVLIAVVRDITERRRAEKIQSVISQVAQSTSTSKNLNDLYEKIHQSLGELMPVDNFYIALNRPQDDLIEYPYWIDQYDPIPDPHPPGRGLTEYVIRTAKPLLASPNALEKLVHSGEVRRLGSPSLDWMGVPLIVEGQTIGIMAVQTYTEGIRFTDQDLNVLSVVSSQIALAIYRKQIEEKLNESEDMYRTLVEASPDVIIVTDRDGNITFASRPFQQLLQIKSLEDILGTNILEWIAPEDQQKLLEDHRRVFTGEGVVNAQFTLVTASGKRIASESNSGLLHSGSGRQNSIVIIMRDITSRKKSEDQLRQALDEKEILVREVHHRVKNNLQIMSSLLSFQQDGISDITAKNALQEAQNRIRSMAYIHEGLYQSKNMAIVDLPAYIQKLIDNLVDLFGARRKVQVHLDIADIRTGIDVAIPCGLIINELVSNSLKYAFEGKKKGVLFVKLDKNTNQTIKQQLELSVIDDGIGIPVDWDLAKSKTLGLQLVNILVKQIKGEIQLIREKGTTFRIFFSEKINDN